MLGTLGDNPCLVTWGIIIQQKKTIQSHVHARLLSRSLSSFELFTALALGSCSTLIKEASVCDENTPHSTLSHQICQSVDMFTGGMMQWDSFLPSSVLWRMEEQEEGNSRVRLSSVLYRQDQELQWIAKIFNPLSVIPILTITKYI